MLIPCITIYLLCCVTFDCDMFTENYNVMEGELTMKGKKFSTQNILNNLNF